VVKRFFRMISLVAFLASLLAGCSAVPASTPAPAPASLAKDLPVNTLGTLSFSHLNLEEGLSQSSVKCILQDQRGFIWLGTEDGLNRYDGYTFTVYRPEAGSDNSLSDRWIEDMVEDQDGNLWLATRLGGLNRFNPVTGVFTRFMHNAQNSNSVVANNINALAIDRQGLIWVATDSGLDSYNPKTEIWSHFNDQSTSGGLSNNKVFALLVDGQGQLWAGTDGGLNRFHPANASFTRVDVLKDLTITQLAAAADGSLWVGSRMGLYHLNVQNEEVIAEFQHEDDNNVSLLPGPLDALLVDHNGAVWAGTRYGLTRLIPESGLISNFNFNPMQADSLSSNTIFSIYEDRSGVVWVGTYGGGVNRYTRGQDQFATFRSNTEKYSGFWGVPFGMFADKAGYLWLASNGGGITRMDPKTGEMTHFRHDPENSASLITNNAWSVFVDSTGTLWAGTEFGLERWNEDSRRFTHFQAAKDESGLSHDIVYAISEDMEGQIWVGTAQGLNRLDLETLKFKRFIDPANPAATLDAVIDIYNDPAGIVWVGTFDNGVYRLDAETGEFTYFVNDPQDSGSLSNNSILDITRDRRGTLWIGTSGGLNRYDPVKNSFRAFTEKEGLPNNVVYGIEEDAAGYLWLSTNNGMARFNPQTETVQTYTINDGLQSNEFNMGAHATLANGAMAFGGVKGFNVFYPENIRTNSFVPPVALTALKRDGEPIETTAAPEALNQITLEYPNNSFEFEFSALSFADPKHNQYAYMLENFDTKWHAASTLRSGRYTNLPGGTYVLHLKASNEDGVWNETGKSIKVVVIPPFWQTGWFYAASVLGLAGMVFGVFRFRMHAVEGQKRELERQVAARTVEIRQLFEQNKELAIIEERNRLARELHDSAKQKAFAAMAQIGTASGMMSGNPQRAKEHLGEAENLVSDVIQELTFLIQEMYPVALKEKGLAVSLREYAFEWESRNDIAAAVEIKNEQRLPLEIEQAGYRIVQEALANVARHSRASQVELAIQYHRQMLEIRVADNGQGFDLSQKPKGMGLRSIAERAESIGGQVDITSRPGQGTTIHVLIPFKQFDKPVFALERLK